MNEKRASGEGGTALTDWKTDIVNWTKISEKTAKLMLDQCESLLKETGETAKSISEKAEKVLGILFPIASALITFLFTKSLKELKDFIPLTCLLGFAVLLISIFFSYRNFLKYKVYVPGEFPNRLVLSTFIDKHENPDHQYVNMVLSICENIQKRIDANEIDNAKRLNYNTISIKILGLLIFCPVVAAVLSPFLR